MLTKDNIEQYFREDYLKFAKKQIERELSDPTDMLLMDIEQFQDICLAWCGHGYEMGIIRGEQCSKENIDKSISINQDWFNNPKPYKSIDIPWSTPIIRTILSRKK